jgi:hypothetical protein
MGIGREVGAVTAPTNKNVEIIYVSCGLVS